MCTLPAVPAWGGLVLGTLETLLAAAEELADVTTNNVNEHDSNVEMLGGYQPQFGNGIVIHVYDNMAAVRFLPPSAM
ncbi:hypothetical protein S7711_11087 [Stachybotrys chartarum IBT 7711]|uniref:Uncharacterized protein n=1 Tax=Stachybotrys chartarum (strain CBS 109288 / IBT 7711) TaxID=1280523 RepID=A0A084B7A9_STACB|nr:hypothetical protein S7711_11087 [Stachybotrys chartarum IBT 7711]KFA71088.1 hypothetical protein S40288_11034 [Stachybotrys chartarum IBT 40288]